MISRVLIAAVSMFALPAAGSAGEAIPRPLAVVLEKQGCLEIDDPSLLRIRKRWWISLQPFTGSYLDYSFFCMDKVDPRRTRLVVHAKSGRNPWKECSEIVASWDQNPRPWLPLDLEVVQARIRFPTRLDLGRWRLVTSQFDGKNEFGPSGAQVPDLVLDTSGQDVGGIFACHSGQWYRIGVD